MKKYELGRTFNCAEGVAVRNSGATQTKDGTAFSMKPAPLLKITTLFVEENRQVRQFVSEWYF
jgi:hypothetical protein